MATATTAAASQTRAARGTLQSGSDIPAFNSKLISKIAAR